MRRAFILLFLGAGPMAGPLFAQTSTEASRERTPGRSVTDYHALLERLCEWAVDSPTLHLFVGSTLTHQGRLVPLVIVTNTPEKVRDTIRIMVLCGQHGDEPYPTVAAMALLEKWATAPPEELAVFDRVTLFLFPLVNPDGAVQGKRENGAGVDLNRDWRARTQPETRYVETLLARWQPHIVVDLHGFQPEDAQSPYYRQPDQVEMLVQPGPAQQPLQRATSELRRVVVGEMARKGWPLQSVASQWGQRAGTLAHRHFAHDRRAVSLLLESGQEKPEPYMAFLETLVQLMNADFAEQKPRLDKLRGVGKWQSPVVEENVTGPTEPPPPVPLPPPPSRGPLHPVLLLYGFVTAAYFGAQRQRMKNADF